MTATIASLIDLEAFLANVWTKSIEVIARDAALISPEDAFVAIVAHVSQAVADCGRSGAPGVRFYLDGKEISATPRVRAFLPVRRDGSWDGYAERVERQGEGRDWCLVINDPPRYTPVFDETCAAFFYPLLEHIGIPLRQYSTELFVGRYEETPFAIHTDAGLESFYCMLQGKKRLWFWEPQRWTLEDFDYPPQLEQLSAAQQEAATVCDLDTGDLLYWPADYWHIGQTPTFAVALGVSVVRPTPQQAGARLRSMALAALQRIAEPCKAEPFLPVAGREPWKSIPMALLTEASRIRSAAQFLEDELQSFWLAVCTNRGSFDSMAPGSEMYPSLEDAACGSWIIELEPSVIVAWRRNYQGTLVVAARGARWDCIDAPAVLALLEQLRDGHRVDMKRCLASLPSEHDSEVDQCDVRHLVASMHSAKVLRRVDAQRSDTEMLDHA